MEKSTATRRKFGIRLLIFIALIYLKTNLLFALPNYDYLKNLQFTKQSNYFFTDEAATFFLNIEDTSPENVSVSVNVLPETISFISSKKEAFVNENKLGTRITLSFNFKKAGNISIPPVEVRVNNLFLQIPIESVLVYENPATILPTLSVKFNKSLNKNNEIFVSEGEHIQFTLYIRYASAITKFSWELPENSLFKEVQRFDILSESAPVYSFSPNLIPVADFDWQPLVQGDFALPNITISALAYNGLNVNLKLPEYKIIVLEKTASDKREQPTFSENLKNAFTEPPSALNTDEHNADLAPSVEKASTPLFTLMLFLCIAFFCLAILSFVLKKDVSMRKNRLGAIFVLLFFLSFLGSIYTGIKAKQKFAVFTGGAMRAIPEEQSKEILYIPKGSYVRVERVIGEWLYISYNKTTGWVHTNSVYFINRYSATSNEESERTKE